MVNENRGFRVAGCFLRNTSSELKNFMSEKANKGGKRPAWKNIELLAKLRHSKEA